MWRTLGQADFFSATRVQYVDVPLPSVVKKEAM
jgi:hypothetical protein